MHAVQSGMREQTTYVKISTKTHSCVDISPIGAFVIVSTTLLVILVLRTTY